MQKLVPKCHPGHFTSICDRNVTYLTPSFARFSNIAWCHLLDIFFTHLSLKWHLGFTNEFLYGELVHSIARWKHSVSFGFSARSACTTFQTMDVTTFRKNASRQIDDSYGTRHTSHFIINSLKGNEQRCGAFIYTNFLVGGGGGWEFPPV